MITFASKQISFFLRLSGKTFVHHKFERCLKNQVLSIACAVKRTLFNFPGRNEKNGSKHSGFSPPTSYELKTNDVASKTLQWIQPTTPNIEGVIVGERTYIHNLMLVTKYVGLSWTLDEHLIGGPQIVDGVFSIVSARSLKMHRQNVKLLQNLHPRTASEITPQTWCI